MKAAAFDYVKPTSIDQVIALLQEHGDDARLLADRATFYDNARAATPFRPVASFERGRQVGDVRWPRWTPAVLG